MKKIVLLLSLLLLIFTASGCVTAKKPAGDTTEQTTEKPDDTVYPPDVWDGTVAESFAAGSGTEADPYLIATGEQLAYLAKSVNEGNTYSGKTVALAADIDLNDLEWIPIGNGNNPFDGTFNGKKHTISNLKITERSEYQYNYTEDRFNTMCVAGLFGVCRNANFENLFISKASVSIPQKEPYNASIYVGVLAGQIFADTSCSVLNVLISDANIHSVRNESETIIGGIIGGIIGKSTEPISCALNRLQCFLSVSRDYYWGSYERNYVGGIIGQAGGPLILNCKDFRSDLTLECPEYEEPSVGTFGWLGGEQVSLENGFGRVKIFPTYGFPETTHAIIGNKNILWASTVQCKNLFGCVMPKDEMSLTIVPDSYYATPNWREEMHDCLYSLYSITPNPERGGSLTEENCVACDALPENHGLDPAVWDLTDLANPKLK